MNVVSTQGVSPPTDRLARKTLLLFFYAAAIIGATLIRRIFRLETVYGAQFTDAGSILATLWVENYPGHDTSSYFAAAWSWYSDGVLESPGWQWVTNLWPPGMVMQSYVILRAFGASAPVVLISAVFALILWSAAIALVTRHIVATRAGVAALILGIPLAIFSHPMQQVLGQHVLLPTGYAVGFAVLGLGTILGPHGRHRVAPIDLEARVTTRFILAGLFFGVSALYRITSYLFLFVVVSALLLLLITRFVRFSSLGSLHAGRLLMNKRLVSSIVMAGSLGLIGFAFSESRRFGLSVAVVLGVAGLLVWTLEVLLRPSTARTALHFVVWGIGIAYACHSLLVYAGVWVSLGARPVGPLWFAIYGTALSISVRGPSLSTHFRASQAHLAPEDDQRRVAPPRAVIRPTGRSAEGHVVALAMVAGMAVGMMLVDSWTTVVTERSHPSVRAYVTPVPELAHGARWRTDEDWISVGAGWLLNTSTNWPCKMQPERCLDVQALERASPAPYSGNGHFSAREFRNMAIAAAVTNPLGYLQERGPYFWIHWSRQSTLQGVFFIMSSTWALGLAAYRLRAGYETRLVALLSLLFLVLSTIPMIYILFFEYYFFPIQLGGLAVIALLSHDV